MDYLFHLVPPHEWPDKKDIRVCQQPGCGRSFTMFSKAANCNACGKVMCQTCLERHLTLPGQPGSTPVPLCHACAVMVAKAQAEAEKAYQQRRDLMKMLDEQQEEMERLLALSSTLRSENERLLHITEDLKAENEQLQMNNKVMEAVKVISPQGTRLLSSSSSSSSPVVSGGSTSFKKDAFTNADTDMNEKDECNGCNFNEKETLLEQRLQKREKVLDMRDATLQEAMKKVSADAARVVAQRFQLQEEERRFKSHLTKQFDTAIEEEIERLQNVHLDELSTLGEQFTEWLESATQVVKETEKNCDTSRNERKVSLSPNVEIELEALKREHTAEMTEKEKIYQEKITQLESSLVKTRLECQEEIRKKEKRFSEDFSVMQNVIGVTKRQLEEEKGHSKEIQYTLDNLRETLQEEREQHESICKKLRERLELVESVSNVMGSGDSGGDGCANSITNGGGDENDKNNSVEETEMHLSSSQHIVQAVYAAVSQWNCVSDMMLSEHSISLEYIRQTVCAFYNNTNTPINGKTNELHQAENSDNIKKLRRELSSIQRSSKDFEKRANEHALEVVNLKREMTTLREQKHQLKEKLSRTEKALLLASGIEKRISKQLQQQEEKQRKVHDENNNNNSNNNNNNNNNNNSGDGVTALVFATQIVARNSSYVDECTRLLGDSLMQHFNFGLQALQYEWEKRHALTRRNTVALEQTTASIKAFQDDLNRREEELRAREREVRLRRTRLLKVSNALQTVAGRLRAAAITEEVDETCKLGSG